MEELIAVLMSWAVTLTSYPMPEKMPRVDKVPHQYLIDNACNGKFCRVMAWFPPGNVIYIDERMDPQNNLYNASILLHEMVHYLQQESRTGIHGSCDDNLAAEREAYGAQREYLHRYGSHQWVGVSMHRATC